MDLRHQARQRFINDVAFGGAGDAETLLLLCECGRSDCHDFVTVPRAAFKRCALQSVSARADRALRSDRGGGIGFPSGSLRFRVRGLHSRRSDRTHHLVVLGSTRP
jgi:hypothetical protein